jgi:hypothetical protein
MIEKQGTCSSCGYEKSQCHCGRKRNSSGEYTAYNNYTDYRNTSDYSMTARINRTQSSDRKIMEELLPINGEPILTYLARTDIAETKLTEYSIQHHLYGTKRVWSCHTSSRYCFICTLAQYVNTNRTLFKSLKDIIDLTNIIIIVDDSTDIPTISLQQTD